MRSDSSGAQLSNVLRDLQSYAVFYENRPKQGKNGVSKGLNSHLRGVSLSQEVKSAGLTLTKFWWLLDLLVKNGYTP